MPEIFVHIARRGDTFDSVSRLVTGTNTSAASIRASNPGLSEPFDDGQRVSVPTLTTGDTSAFKTDGIDIRVAGSPVNAFDNFQLSMASDGFRMLSFGQTNNETTRDAFPQMTPVKTICGIDGQQVFTGYLNPVVVQSSKEKNALDISASSTPNLLNVKAPASGFPINFGDSDLEVIAYDVCYLYAIESVFKVPSGARFTKPAMQRSDTGLGFLSGLAAQRSMILTDDEQGRVVFWGGDLEGDPAVIVDDDKRPDALVEAQYNASNYYSDITGVLTAKTKRREKTYTIQNPHYSGIVKSQQVEFSDIDPGELETATRSAMGRMFADAFSVAITVPGWRGNDFDLFAPGKRARVKSPSQYIFDFVDLVIRRVDLLQSRDQKIARLECVLPGVFSGIVPASVPWVAQ